MFGADNLVVDRLAYGDNVAARGGPRTQTVSGRPLALATLGANDSTLWTLASVGDIEGLYRAVNGEIASPGRARFNSVTAPAMVGPLALALFAARRRH